MEEIQLQKIESYLGGTMPQEKIIPFELEMESNAQLKEAVILSKQLNHHLAGHYIKEVVPSNEYTQKLKAVLNSDDAITIKNTIRQVGEEYRLSKAIPKKSNLLWVVSIAAILVLFVGLNFFNQTSGEELYAQYYNSGDVPSMIMRDGEITNLSKGVEAFEAGQYKDALDLFSLISSETSTQETALTIYKGIAYSQTNNLEAAISQFDQVINSNSLDASKGLWFKGLTYLKSGDKGAAKQVLGQLEQGEFNYGKAQEIIDEL